MNVASFGPVAPHYDELMRTVPYEMWVGYTLLLFAHLDVQPKTVLDVCCGTGSVAELLHENGYRVTGFDLSEPMIERARAKALERGFGIDYHVLDAAELRLNRTFDAAVSYFDSLNYIVQPDRLAQAIARVGEHLEPGGVFLFDVNTAYAFEKRMFDQQCLTKRSPLRYKWVGNYDAHSRVIRVHMDFWKGDEHFVEEHVQRAYSIEELRDYLADAGFDEVHTFDAYTLDPPRRRSDRLHFAAVKGG